MVPPPPELVQNCDDDDEVLLLVAQTLGVMMDEVGGIDYAHELLAPLEQLTGADDPAVRAQTSDSIRKLCVVMSEANIEAHMVPLLQRLATGEWISSRISATSLFDCVYPRVRDARRKELRALYLALCKTEEVAAVKRAAAQHFGEFASVIDARDVKEELFPVLQKLVRDEQDSVRLLTIAACVSVAKIFGREANMKPLNVRRQLRPIIGAQRQ
jgi:serine/threonine-protein phosphatase 2A regulatory subunit A